MISLFRIAVLAFALLHAARGENLFVLFRDAHGRSGQRIFAGAFRYHHRER